MTPFDYLKLVHNKKVKWEDLNEEEQKSWNTFIINRALSFNSNYTINQNNCDYCGEPIKKDEVLCLSCQHDEYLYYNNYTSNNVNLIDLAEMDREEIDQFVKDKIEIDDNDSLTDCIYQLIHQPY